MEIPKIKICGITQPEEAEYLNEAKVNYAGFVFFEKSKRNIDIRNIKEIFEKLNQDIKKVAVMVEPDIEKLKQIQDLGFDIVQIHGNLKPEVLHESILPIWKAVHVSRIEELKTARKDWNQQKITAYVVDAPEAGSGKTFNWQAGDLTEWEKLKEEKEMILAGGLHSGNVKEAIRIFHPHIVDVSSGVEGEKGKDRKKILEFVDKIRSETKN